MTLSPHHGILIGLILSVLIMVLIAGAAIWFF